MKKKHSILLLIIFLTLSPGLLFGSGEKDKSIIVPAKAVALARIDVQQNLDSGIAPMLLDLLYTFREQGTLQTSGKTLLDEECAGMFGIGSGDIETITLSLVSFEMPGQEIPSGIHIKLKQDMSKEVLHHIRETYDLSTGNYIGKTYFIVLPGRQKIPYTSRETCVYTEGEDLLLSTDTSVMESLLDVLYGPGSIQDNQKLYTIVKEYKDNPFYIAGYVPEDTDPAVLHPFEQIREFVLTIMLDREISFLLKIRTDSTEMAEELITAVKGYLALAGMALLSQDKEAYVYLVPLIQGIEYEQKGSHALISGNFTRTDLQHLLDLAPELFMMMK